MRSLTIEEENLVVGGDGISCAAIPGGGTICSTSSGSTVIETVFNSAGTITQTTICSSDGSASAQLTLSAIAGKAASGSLTLQGGGGVSCNTVNWNGNRPADAKSWWNWIINYNVSPTMLSMTQAGTEMCAQSYGYSLQSLATSGLKGNSF